MLSIKLRGFAGAPAEIFRRGFNAAKFSCLLIAALTLGATACTPSTRIGNAVITQVDGMPCFGIPNNAETRNGVPLSTVIVTKTNPPGVSMRPADVWFAWTEPRTKPLIFKPGQCIRYGAFPQPSHQEAMIPLQPYSVYGVSLDAIPEGSNLRGYTAEFCLIPDAAKKMRVEVVPWDEPASRWRYELCAPSAT